MKVSIKKKIIQSFCLLTCMILLAQVGFNVFLSKSFFVSQNKKDLEALYNLIAEYYSDDVDVLYTLTQEADSTKGYSVQIFSDTEMIYTSRTTGNIMGGLTPNGGQKPDGENVSPNGPQPEGENIPPIGPLPDGEEIQPLQNNKGGVASEDGGNPTRNLIPNDELSSYSETPHGEIISNDNSGIEILMLRGKINYNEEVRYINIALPMESITNSIDLFTKSNILISFMVLALGSVMIIGLAKNISKPIKNIEKVSQKLANLDFSYTADESVTTIELGSLASSINSMSRQLEQSMSQLKNANIELQKDVNRQKELDNMRKQFVANVSHEMKTPLALVQIYCDNLKNNVGEKNKDKYCDIIIEETNRLNKIVSDMLNISSLENMLTNPNKEYLNLSEISQKLVNTMKPLLDEYELIVDIAPDLHVLGNKEQLEEAMRNYINNGISHTKEGDKIEISLKEIDNSANFILYNDGEKIPEEDILHLWESFYKSDAARSRVEGTNAGLGLYVVKLTVDSHGGVYGVENEQQGVRFSFGIPIQNKINER